MCTSIVEIVRAEGMAKRGDAWFPLSRTVVAYDHARHAPLGDVITLDFINMDLDPGARAGIELTLETAKERTARRSRPGDCCRRVRRGGSAGQGRRSQPRSSRVTSGPAVLLGGGACLGAGWAAGTYSRSRVKLSPD
jgi:hypothetical protein